MLGKRGVPAHRLTTAHLQAVYPFVAEGGLGGRGVYIGRDLFGAAFTYDAFELYDQGVLTSPNMLVAGQIGRGKSAFVKSFLWRQQVFGRRAVVMDPKGEYGSLARACDVEPIRLEPGGRLRLNPLDRRVAREEQLRLLQAIGSAALDRPLLPQEKTAMSIALEQASTNGSGSATLPGVVECLIHPRDDAGHSVGAEQGALREWGRETGFELRRLVAGDLAGMFDGPTSAEIDLGAPLVVLDLSAVYSSEALGSQEERVARGLLSDAETRVVFGQPHGEVDATRDLLGLTATEASLLPTLDRGVALWKVGQRSFLVEQRLGGSESEIVDTDSRMIV